MVYFFWSFHSASEGTFNFENGAHDVQRVFDYAKQAGLYVIARAGPYVNGETSAGGFALWAANGQMGSTRTSAESYYERWLPWILNIGKLLIVAHPRQCRVLDSQDRRQGTASGWSIRCRGSVLHDHVQTGSGYRLRRSDWVAARRTDQHDGCRADPHEWVPVRPLPTAHRTSDPVSLPTWRDQ